MNKENLLKIIDKEIVEYNTNIEKFDAATDNFTDLAYDQGCRNTLKYIRKCQNHIVTAETKWFFTSERKQG